MNTKNSLLGKVRDPDFTYRYSHMMYIYIFLAVAMAVLGIANDKFATAPNLSNIIASAFPLILVSFGQTLIMMTGGIDLSVGGIVALTNVFSTYVMTEMNNPTGVVLSLVGTMVVGVLCGALNGILVTKGRLPAIIITIGTASVFQGIGLFIMEIPGGMVYMDFAKLYNETVLGLPMPLILTVVIVVILRLFTNSTAYGKAIRAIGGNEGAAFGSGIQVWKVKLKTYVLAGFFCSLAGIALSLRMYSADPNIGSTYSMYSITAAVVGGTSISGAKGDVLGTVAGALIIFIINNALNLFGVSTFYQYVCQGAVLIIALTVGAIRTNMQNAKK